MSMSGLRASNFSSAQGIAYMHESLYAAVGKRLPYVLNMGCRAITKSSLNVHCGHDDYHCIDDTGFAQVLGKNAQEAADLNLIGRKLAELSLTPAVVAQDGFLTTHLIEPLQVPERELIAEFLGRPDDIIDCPTPAQRLVYGATRRRVPELWSVDNPIMAGPVENQDSYMQSVVAQRPYFFDHVAGIADQVMEEYYQLTGRRYRRVSDYRMDDAEYVILGQGSMIVQAEAVADYLRESRKLKVGVVNVTMYRPFPGDLLGRILKGRRGVAVLERTDQPLAEDLRTVPRPAVSHPTPAMTVTVSATCRGCSRAVTASAAATCSRRRWWPPSRTCCPTLSTSRSTTCRWTSCTTPRPAPSRRSTSRT
jgi:pyruvate-ferredoxin/flavodoxin oxidoreductase